MTDSHNYSFFGQKTGMIVQSAFKSEPFVFIKLLKKKPNSAWEKLSNGEGKTIKFSLEELVSILQVLRQETQSWSSYHKYKGNSTQISFTWQQDKEQKLERILWINIDNYSKMLNYAQSEILKLLLTHILQEKIEFATIPELPQIIDYNNIPKKNINELSIEEEIETKNNQYNEQSTNQNIITKNDDETITIIGTIKAESQKALLITFLNGVEFWVPKSVIRSQFDQEKEKIQSFTIDKWILEKNKAVT